MWNTRTGMIAVVAALFLVVSVCSSGLLSAGRSHEAMPMPAGHTGHAGHGAAAEAMSHWAAQPDTADDCVVGRCCLWAADKRQRRDGSQGLAALAPVAGGLSAPGSDRAPFIAPETPENRAPGGSSSPLRL